MKKPIDIVIGIDPDTVKNGFSVINNVTGEITTENLSFNQSIEKIKRLSDESKQRLHSIIVVVEASWRSTHNWHTENAWSKGAIAKTGYSVGRNHQVGMLIVEYCQYHNIEVKEQHPLKKCWKGPDGKISHDELRQFISDIPRRTNQEQRDSLLLAWNYLGR